MKALISYRFSGRDPVELQTLLTITQGALGDSGIQAYVAFFDTPENKGTQYVQVLRHALRVIDNSDFLFVILDSPERSEGMLMEVGYGLAKSKPLIVAHRHGSGFSRLPELAGHAFAWSDLSDLSRQIKAFNFNSLIQSKSHVQS